MAQSYLLTKSKYIHGLQCDRALWLDVFNPKLARYSAEQMRRFDHGREFEYSFKDTFPNGIDISAELKRNTEAYPALTAQLLDKEEETDLFEAGFLYNEVLVLADVVHRRSDGSLDVYEVKSGSTLSDTYRRDAAIQHYVISHCHPIHSFNIVHNTPSEKSDNSENSDKRFTIINLTEELQAQHSEIENNIALMKEILRHGEPATPTGQHCLTPYACPYQHYCAQGIRQLSLF
jgi:hypothetical protein